MTHEKQINRNKRDDDYINKVLIFLWEKIVFVLKKWLYDTIIMRWKKFSILPKFRLCPN